LLGTLQGGYMNIEKGIGYEIKTINNLIERKIILESKLNNNNNLVTMMQGKIMKYLFMNKNKKIFNKDIEEHLRLRRSTVSGILKTMEKNGLIIRIENEEDARRKQIILTNTSLEKGKEIKDKMIKFEKEIRKNITEEELNIFFIVTEKIKNNIEN